MYDGGQGMLEDNDIFGNRLFGSRDAQKTANPIFRNNRINKNGEYGI